MQATCWKSDEFRYILQPASCSHPIFQIKKKICTFYIDIHSLKYFQSIYRSCCKVRTRFVTCKLGDCRVWTLTNPINSKPTHNSGGGVGIRTDSHCLERSVLFNLLLGIERTASLRHTFEDDISRQVCISRKRSRKASFERKSKLMLMPWWYAQLYRRASWTGQSLASESNKSM